MELDCLDTGEWQEHEVLECVPRLSFSQGKLAGVIIGTILVATLLAWSILFLMKRQVDYNSDMVESLLKKTAKTTI